MSRGLPFDPVFGPPRGRFTLAARTVWTTELQLHRYTAGMLSGGSVGGTRRVKLRKTVAAQQQQQLDPHLQAVNDRLDAERDAKVGAMPEPERFEPITVEEL